MGGRARSPTRETSCDTREAYFVPDSDTSRFTRELHDRRSGSLELAGDERKDRFDLIAQQGD
jgi:hypothetical protein